MIYFYILDILIDDIILMVGTSVTCCHRHLMSGSVLFIMSRSLLIASEYVAINCIFNSDNSC